MGNKAAHKKANRRGNVGVYRARSYSWLLSSPQQPLETEDPPTVSLAPQYTPQCLCHASSKFPHAPQPCYFNTSLSTSANEVLKGHVNAVRGCKTYTFNRVEFSYPRAALMVEAKSFAYCS